VQAEALEEEARAGTALDLCLTDVPGFFGKRGFEQVNREELPLKASKKTACAAPRFPACDEIAVRKRLTTDTPPALVMRLTRDRRLSTTARALNASIKSLIRWFWTSDFVCGKIILSGYFPLFGSRGAGCPEGSKNLVPQPSVRVVLERHSNGNSRSV
jgi:hypothetical protein